MGSLSSATPPNPSTTASATAKTTLATTTENSHEEDVDSWLLSLLGNSTLIATSFPLTTTSATSVTLPATTTGAAHHKDVDSWILSHEEEREDPLIVRRGDEFSLIFLFNEYLFLKTMQHQLIS